MTWLNWPNRITIVRIALIAPLVIGLMNVNSDWNAMRHATLGLFCLMALSDALDGLLARRLGQETPLGRFLDPLGDKLLVTCAVIILALPDTAVPGARLPSWVPVIAIGKDILVVAGFTLVRLTTGKVFIQPRLWGKLTTLLQLLMIATVLITPDLPAGLRLAAPVLWCAASVAAVIATVDYLRIGNRFAAQVHRDTKPT